MSDVSGCCIFQHFRRRLFLPRQHVLKVMAASYWFWEFAGPNKSGMCWFSERVPPVMCVACQLNDSEFKPRSLSCWWSRESLWNENKKKTKHKEQKGSEAAVKGHYVAVRKINRLEKESDGDVHFVCLSVCVCVCVCVHACVWLRVSNASGNWLSPYTHPEGWDGSLNASRDSINSRN